MRPSTGPTSPSSGSACDALAARRWWPPRRARPSPRGLLAPASSYPRAGVQHEAYGADPSQYGELYHPGRVPLATVVAIHGGYWADGFNADAMRPMCRALQAAGYAVWNLEYRRLGGGGGWPMTFADVAAGVDHLNVFDTVDAGDVRAPRALCRRSARRLGRPRGATPRPAGRPAVTVTRCVSLAGVLDLTEASGWASAAATSTC